MDARRAMLRIMRRYGHDVYLRRRLADTSPAQYSDRHYSHRERHTVREMIPSARLAGARSEKAEGVISEIDVVYWFLWGATPKEGDLVEEPQVGKRYVIDYAHALRGERGRIEYWTCGCKQTDPN